MGASSSAPLNKSSTAREVIDVLSGGNANTFLAGRVAVVTGGNSGIGAETVKALASAGCKVYLGCRRVLSGDAAVLAMMKPPGLENVYSARRAKELVVVHALDLEDLASVRNFAETILREPRLDFLVLNAGIMAVPELSRTKYGWERQLATNHFGHFYLVKLLRDKMCRQSTASRIVVVASEAHKMVGRDALKFDDLHFEQRPYNPWTAYGQSKLANILMARQLSDELGGSLVTVVSLHPGIVRTNLIKANFKPSGVSPVVGFFLNHFLFDKTIPQGAANSIFACLAPSWDERRNTYVRQDSSVPDGIVSLLPGGTYIMDCDNATPSSIAYDESKELRRLLWKVTDAQLNSALEREAGV